MLSFPLSPEKAMKGKAKAHKGALLLNSENCLTLGAKVTLGAKPAPTQLITSQPTCSFCCKCILQGAIDFAKAAYPRKARRGRLCTKIEMLLCL